ncbi:recombinase family protein [bacterium]|jgi:DNA invertase Pin-like site-specific DNA recombinase|nr:recombinase family protein [bacterium]
MSKVLAYLRTSTDKQDLNNQRLEILEYARQHSIQIADFIAVSVSSRKTPYERRIDELLLRLNENDTLLVTELSRLGRSTGQVINLIDELIDNGICIIVIKQHLILNKSQDDLQSLTMITMLSLFAQMERMMISRRTKEALATKKALGIHLGKPKGTIQSSIYDKDRERIIELLCLGVSVRHISIQHLNYGSISSLNYYVNTRGLREKVKNIE